ncbi:hypothetical protein IAD21_00843 [Abditibacteriota bacterium]|nr:hypothetical protein IAD21_00843 [Abditibacteriota bacterium]
MQVAGPYEVAFLEQSGADMTNHVHGEHRVIRGDGCGSFAIAYPAGNERHCTFLVTGADMATPAAGSLTNEIGFIGGLFMTNLEDIGTLGWSKRTGGELSRSEREGLLKQALNAQVLAAKGEGLADFRVTEAGLARVDSGKIRIPDSRTARESERLMDELGQPSLVNHCYRTYWWGCLLAQHDAIVIEDEEAFYIASLLHDLGLTERHFCCNAEAHCFAVEGAFAADEFLATQGWEQTRRDVVAEAITLHLNMMLDLTHGPLAHYLSAGAKCDVVGARSTDIPPTTIEEVLRRYPGLRFADEFAALLGAEAQARPHSRIGFVLSNLSLGELFPLGKLEGDPKRMK